MWIGSRCNASLVCNQIGLLIAALHCMSRLSRARLRKCRRWDNQKQAECKSTNKSLEASSKEKFDVHRSPSLSTSLLCTGAVVKKRFGSVAEAQLYKQSKIALSRMSDPETGFIHYFLSVSFQKLTRCFQAPRETREVNKTKQAISEIPVSLIKRYVERLHLSTWQPVSSEGFTRGYKTLGNHHKQTFIL